jgi:hypothetical protein
MLADSTIAAAKTGLRHVPLAALSSKYTRWPCAWKRVMSVNLRGESFVSLRLGFDI